MNKVRKTKNGFIFKGRRYSRIFTRGKNVFGEKVNGRIDWIGIKK